MGVGYPACARRHTRTGRSLGLLVGVAFYNRTHVRSERLRTTRWGDRGLRARGVKADGRADVGGRGAVVASHRGGRGLADRRPGVCVDHRVRPHLRRGRRGDEPDLAGPPRTSWAPPRRWTPDCPQVAETARRGHGRLAHRRVDHHPHRVGRLGSDGADRCRRWPSGSSGWQCWSRKRIINAVDAAVSAADPEAAKERRVNADTDATSPSPPNPTAWPASAAPCPLRPARSSTNGSHRWPPRCAAATRRTIEQRRIDALRRPGRGPRVGL